MKGKFLKYSKSSIKNREELGSKASGTSFSNQLKKDAEVPFCKKFNIVHNQNGYVDIIPKKKS